MKYLLIFSLTLLISTFYLIIDIQNDFISKVKKNSFLLQHQFESSNVIKQLNDDLSQKKVVFLTKNEAQEAILDKIAFYKKYFNANFNSNIVEKDDKFYIYFEISNEINKFPQVLSFLKNDSYLKLMNFKKTNDIFIINLSLTYFFIKEK